MNIPRLSERMSMGTLLMQYCFHIFIYVYVYIFVYFYIYVYVSIYTRGVYIQVCRACVCMCIHVFRYETFISFPQFHLLLSQINNGLPFQR